MPRILSTFFSEFPGLKTNDNTANPSEDNLLEDIEVARREWTNACAFFEQVSEPDLVDMAIYSMEAAEKRYIYLLKLAKHQGLQLAGYPEINL